MDIGISWSELSAFFQVILIDLSLAGDNAIVIGMAAATLQGKQKRQAIFYGIAGAAALRILFACGVAQLMDGSHWVLLVGGLLLFWVCWKMAQDLRGNGKHKEAKQHETKTLALAVWQIVVADFSMSLDNVLAVAGAAREHMWVLVTGLLLSVILMGAAATAVEKLLRRYPWLAYLGLAIIVYVAARMVWDGVLLLI